MARTDQQKKVPPRKFEYTEENRKRIITYAQCQLTVKQIAGCFGITDDTFAKIRDQYPEINALILENRNAAMASVAGALIKNAMAGDVNAQKFALERKFGWINTERREIVNADGDVFRAVNVDVKLNPENANKLYLEMINAGKDDSAN